MLGRLVTGLAVLVALGYLLVGLNVGLSVYGEGLSLYGAMRVLDGDVPYRDFWSMYAPGELYLLAGLFSVFNPSILLARLFSCLINLALVVTVYVILRIFLSRTLSLIGMLLTAVWIGVSLRFFTYPVFPSLLLILVSVYFLVRYMCEPRRTPLILSGVLAGLAAFFRHDLAAYALFAELFVLVGFGASARIQTKPRPRSPVPDVFAPLGPYLLGALIATLPSLVYFLVLVPTETLIYDLVTFPVRVFPRVRGLPYPAPGIDTLLFYVPFVVHGAAVGLLLLHSRRASFRWDRPRVWTRILFIALGILFFNQARVRSDTSHLFPFLLSSVVPFCFLIDDWVSDLRTGGRSLTHGIAAVTVLLVVWSAVEPVKQRWQLARIYWVESDSYTLESGRGRGIIVPKAARNYESLVKYVQRVVPENERIYVGPLRHDLVSICDVLLYFLTARHSATPYHEPHPGLTTTEEVQGAIARDIERAAVNHMVLIDHFEREPNESAISSGVIGLDIYIRANFDLARQFKEFGVWKRSRPRRAEVQPTLPGSVR